MAELKPYSPSLRDRLAAMLAGDAKPGSGRYDFVEGLMGSTGLGNTGPGPGGSGLVDFLPGGQVFAAQEAAREGDFQGAGLAIMPLPGANRSKILAGRIRAYHGSPHDFDRFDLSKIGTGEGAQAYGHGLYFAENEGVAKSYRDALAKPELRVKDDAGQLIDPRQGSTQNMKFAGDLIAGFDGDVNKALADVDYMHRTGRMNDDDAAMIRNYIDLWSKDGIEFKPNPGRMYEVEIDADPAQFLDWDKPLSGQPDAMQKAVLDARYGGNADYIAKSLEDPGYMGRSVGSHLYDLGHEKVTGSPAAASRALAERGIPGIKYLDAGSRAAGDGSRNYVLFRDDIINILRKYGVATITALPPAVQMMIQQNAAPEALSGEQ